MPSNYPLFEVSIDTDDGLLVPVPFAVVEVRDVTDPGNVVQLADAVADASGIVPGATVAVDPGRRLRFTCVGPDGVTGFAEEVTT